ncbi:inactive leucine-rich repeat receptor-like protein kinase CORYNE [Amborella trichopoda]|uniref:Protein kinase domain-containing protein n=1 Tax=Amborella trichopoda TaxID=13333 RepID=W1PE38_AMBTC|nr:inactive leucine-rich repeat receptor-like protein kinase CORYNE [Amborella trichopoda]ERN06213.1 hypothetical protein AMTR_s00016p00166940 [Amborella trichopoda]|eukprot:XP_020522984.1 inactive leucine-rich repeat receptor-like protein kinase CORYNE [Amborella trichopoda]
MSPLQKTIFLLQLFLLCYLFPLCQSRETLSFHQSTPWKKALSPSSNLHGNRSQPKRIALGVLLGTITGFLSAVLVATFIRISIFYLSRTPILKGPVIFSPKITSKTIISLIQENPLPDCNLIGSNSNGKYYKAHLENGSGPLIAIKKIETQQKSEPKSTKRLMQQELEVLGRLKHRNILSLRAYIHESNGFFLFYDYMPNGSLEEVMKKVRSNQLQLSWEVRHRIAVGVIKGLQYLHFGCNPRVLHYNLKLSNVILDEEFEPRLGDLGLIRVLPNLGKVGSGYTAPEYLQSCRYTDKSDIFSFGVVLAVLLTGRDPMDSAFGEGGGGSMMGRWLRQLQQVGDAREGLDEGLVGEEGEEEEMLMAMRIAVVCLSDMPADRPSSEELVPMLTQLHSF